LVFLVFQRISGRKFIVAAIVALLFGIHPMHVESVSWISGLKDVLYSAFFLGSILFYLAYSDKKATKYYILSLIFFILSLLSKSMAVSLPLVLILIDYFMSGKPLLRHVSEKIPFFLLSIVFGVIAFLSQKEGITFEEVNSRFNMIDKIFLVSYALLFYPFKLFAPFNLSALHSYPVKSGALLPVEYYLSFLICILIIWGLIRLLRTNQKTTGKALQHEFNKTLVFGILFYLVTIIFVLQIVPVGRAIVAERYSYMPYLGLFFIIADGFYLTIKHKYRLAGKLKPYFLLVLFLLIVFSAYSTVNRNKVWKDDISLFENVTNKTSGRAYAYYVLGKAAEDKDKMEEAIENYSLAIEADSNFTDAYYNRGSLNLFYYMKQREAAVDLEKAVMLDNKHKLAYNNLGIAYTSLHKFDEAVEAFNMAIKLDKLYVKAYFNIGIVYIRKKEYTEAIKWFNKAIELKNDYIKAYFQRGFAELKLKMFNEALDDFLIVKRVVPEDAQLLLLIGDVRHELHDIYRACEAWNKSADLGHKIAVKKVEEYCK
jgi:tetratricopeptide (TPR) repeat protein